MWVFYPSHDQSRALGRVLSSPGENLRSVQMLRRNGLFQKGDNTMNAQHIPSARRKVGLSDNSPSSHAYFHLSPWEKGHSHILQLPHNCMEASLSASIDPPSKWFLVPSAFIITWSICRDWKIVTLLSRWRTVIEPLTLRSSWCLHSC